uniref:ABC-2 type transporter transmembrane domain-containing protein n=1 Tax=Amphimedon queenslandica TaxID=400682 RepID=A0A1X7SM46_AMPQE
MMRHSSNPAHINTKKAKKIRPQASWFARLAVLEARASKRASLIWMFYLPVIFFVYGFVLGTTYLQQDSALFVLSGFCVYSVASALFMFPVLQNYYIKALEVYRYEKADGAGRAQDLVFQGFFRFSTMAIIPVVFSAGVLYLLTVKMEFWDGMVFLDLAIINMALNQTWIALLTFVLCAFPNYSARLSPMISSVAGFSSGFFVPRDETEWYYRWIFYINPN